MCVVDVLDIWIEEWGAYNLSAGKCTTGFERVSKGGQGFLELTT